jgi:hypothetical protein
VPDLYREAGLVCEFLQLHFPRTREPFEPPHR